MPTPAARTPGLDRRVALVVLVVSVILAGSAILGWATQVSSVRERGSDFSVTYVAGLVWRDGNAARLYDQGLEQQRHGAITPPETIRPLPFLSAPSSAVVGAAFTLLDPGAAFRLFSVIQFLLLLAATAVALRAAPWPRGTPQLTRLATAAAAVACTGTSNLILLGQWDGLNALGIALAYRFLRRGQPLAAGFAAVLPAMLAKPHLALGLVAWMLGRRCGRGLAGAAVGAALGIGGWLLLTGWTATAAFPHGALGAVDSSPPASMLGVTGFVASWTGTGGAQSAVAMVGAAFAVLAAVALGTRSRHTADGGPGAMEPSLAAAIGLGLLASPHLLAHDLVLLCPALVWLVAWSASRAHALPRAQPASVGLGRALGPGGVLAGWAALNVGALFDIGGEQAPPGRLVPVALVALGVVAWTVTRTAEKPASEAR